jgi:hypothetical protein
VFVRDSRFVQSSDVQTNRGDPVVCLLEIGLHGENLLQRFERFGVLDTLRRTPQDERSRQMSLRQCRVKQQRPGQAATPGGSDVRPSPIERAAGRS